MTVRSLNKLESFLIASEISRGASTPIGVAQMNCEKHGVYMAKGIRLRSKDVWASCPDCLKDAEVAEQKRKAAQREEAAQAEVRRQMQAASVPARFSDRTLSNFRAEAPDQIKALSVASEFASNWSETSAKGRWLVFSGLPGTGKSHLAIAILKALMPARVGRYMTCMELIQMIRSTWRKDSEQSETEVLESLGRLPLLVIDEVGVQYGTDSEQNHLFDVLDRRYREMMPTILLTNQNKDGFRTFVGDRVYDRMTECAKWVPFTWQSYRPQARKEMEEA